MKTRTLLTTFTALFLSYSSVTQAAFPERPITIVVPYSPGGAADTVARLIANELGDKLATNVIVENRPGASGTIGANNVARAKPDGYTILYDATPYSINPHLFAKLPFDNKALEPLSLVLLAANALIVRDDSPYKDVNDLIADAKANPGKLNFASGGSGTVQRLASELFRQELDLEMEHIPYKSGGPAIVDVLGGQVDFMFATVAASAPLVSPGKLRVLAVSSPERSALLPEVETVSETVIPGYEAYEWNGMFVPAGTPEQVKETLHAAIVEVVNGENIKKRLSDLGAQSVASTPNEFSQFLEEQDKKWAQVIEVGNIKLD
ncbi:Bug family tripartite tricarboxylate transporter substrate binding protein [Alcaligenes endophyticus]|uniref:Tripartite tricarboxylate transporter substrate binding protein n=1 Tax=Alcaligenes endophyticus TaxID=1929088 RepID=A0ABT8EJV0_9BURK|nr:tripartite tricarboxylate transporter substrate binding protein [Alcaligenes endophyticus]MCX5591862.1 tripartite tricarboxylate transporter substrate binding protein [Alcaligenes endophyticus]MDN4121552.1 tripartite tricarboxylate transporter substrate binding protein [Alcaligenes endophyticus]